MAVYLVSLQRLAAARARRTSQPVEVQERETASDLPRAQSETAHQSVGPIDAPASAVQPKRKRTTKRKSPKTAAAPSHAETPEGALTAALSADTPEANLRGDSGVIAEVEQLLHLPRAQVGELLASCDEPTRKVLLALIYRLAAVEDELRGVSAKVRSAGVRAIQSATFRAPPPAAAPNEKGGLLEQLFQKNVSLRKGP